MCGRFHLNSTPVEIANLFDLDIRDNFPPRYNVAPTQPIAVIHMNESRERQYSLMRWGFIPSWAKGETLTRMGSKPLINARGETVAEKPTFRHAYKRRRCLIPADGFYEWKRQGGDKQPFRIYRESGAFAFAGIWETAVDRDGGEIDTTAILTIAAGAQISTIHHREPVVVAHDQFNHWLTADEGDTDAINDLVAPAKADEWQFYAVSKDVGAVRNDGPHLIEPAKDLFAAL